MLVAVLVYGGRSFVPDCLSSAAGLRVGHDEVDVVVLDDCSPDAGWSDELAATCDLLGLAYYRSPRNLGIPRNMNLALLLAQDGGYDHAIVVNSDVVLPMNLVRALVAVAETDERIGSVTAWSNNASAFSIPNHDASGLLRRQDTVDWISAELRARTGDVAVDLPTGVGFCLLLSVPAVRRVGLFDPLYGRGYCEEVDWSLRSRAAGYRAVLAPSAFVYHLGSGSTAGAGLVAAAETTVAEHERIIDLRYPSYRAEVADFVAAGVVARLAEEAARTIVVLAAQRWGYDVEVAWLAPPADAARPRVVVPPGGADPVVGLEFCGFRHELGAAGGDVVAVIDAMIGVPPARVTLHDRGRHADAVSTAWGPAVPVHDRYRYPQRV